MRQRISINDSEYDRLKNIIKGLVEGDPKEAQKRVVFSGESLGIIFEHFSKILVNAENSTANDAVNSLLSRWESQVYRLRKDLIDSAEAADSYVESKNGERIIMIRETDGGKVYMLCPPGPGNYLVTEVRG